MSGVLNSWLISEASVRAIASVSASGMSASARSVRQPAFEFTQEAQDHLLALFPLVDGR